jgi:type I restriction enzyme S subunit
MADDGWRETTVGVLCDEGVLHTQTGPFGSQLHSYDYVPSGVPVVPTEGIGRRRLLTEGIPEVAEETAARLSRHRLKAGDILFARRGVQATGLSAIVTPRQEGWLCGTGAILLRINGKAVDPEFLSFFLSAEESVLWLKQHAVGAVMPNLNESVIRQIPLTLPPLAEQKAIAAVLGALDDKIELNRRMNATLEAMARALFQSWFVDFDPVRAKLDGRLPAALDAATAALFPEHFGHGEDGILPLGWRQTTIEEVCAVNASTLGKNDDLETLEYVEISEVIRGNIANIATYTRGDEPSRARRRLRHGDTVLSTVRPDRGSYFLALNPPDNRVASTGFAVITPTKVPWSFLHAALTQPEVSKHLGQMADGGAYPAVRPEIIGAMKVGLPDDTKILEAFHRTCAPLFEQAEANRAQSRTLATLRDTLLPKLLSGELSVASPL